MSKNVRKILVPTDLSSNARLASKQAALLARHFEASLVLFHAVLLHEQSFEHMAGRWADLLEKKEEGARQMLEQEAATIAAGGIHTEIATEKGVSAFDSISDAVARLEPDLIVMGTHGHGGVVHFLVGSVAEKVLRHIEVPVMTLRGDAVVVEAADSGVDRILVPIDFSDHSRSALAMARELVSEQGVLILAHVVTNPVYPSFLGEPGIRLFDVDPELPSRMRSHLEQWLEGQRGEVVVKEGGVHQELMKVLQERETQMVVMGSRGLSRLDHFLMGSEAEKMVRAAPVPVLTVK